MAEPTTLEEAIEKAATEPRRYIRSDRMAGLVSAEATIAVAEAAEFILKGEAGAALQAIKYAEDAERAAELLRGTRRRPSMMPTQPEPTNFARWALTAAYNKQIGAQEGEQYYI